MKILNAGLRVVTMAGLMVVVAACSSTPDENASATSTPSAPVTQTQPSGPTPGSQQDLVVNVGDRVFFETDRSDLTSDPSRIRTISYGKERPVALCSSESCWSQNRRAVSVVSGAGS